MDEAGTRPTTSLWRLAVLEGLRAFGIVAAIGVVASVLVWLVAGPAYGFAVALRIGAIYLGAFHHAPIRVEGVFDLGELTGGVLPNSDAPTSGTSFVEVGVALMAVTLVAGWLLFRAGRRLGGDPMRPLWRSALRGAAPAPVYAAALLLVAHLVRIDEPLGLGRLVDGRLQVSIVPIPALAWSLAIAATAGAAGGLWAALGGRREGAVAAAMLAGGWRMLWVGLVLAYAGLVLAGIVQPDRPVALLTPSTARYVEVVFDRPQVGAVVLGHHLALAPNEAVWALVPAVGGCDVVRGSDEGDLVCLWRSRSRERALVDVPDAYRLFALAPLLASLLGGRTAAGRLGASGRAGARAGALAGVVFALALGAASVLAGVSLVYGATVGAHGGSGAVWAGPHVPTAIAFGLGWGVLGGALGGATASIRSAAPATR